MADTCGTNSHYFFHMAFFCSWNPAAVSKVKKIEWLKCGQYKFWDHPLFQFFHSFERAVGYVAIQTVPGTCIVEKYFRIVFWGILMRSAVYDWLFQAMVAMVTQSWKTVSKFDCTSVEFGNFKW